MPSPEAQAPFALKFGVLEPLITRLLGTTETIAVSRFRKLRPKFAADGLLTETGNRVSYDLTRALAICAVFELNALSIPQGHAVDIVVANWPEIARACLAAHDTAQAGAAAKRDWSPVLLFYVDALNEPVKDGTWASLAAKDASCGPHVSLDFSPIVAAVTDAAGRTGQKDALALAFAELEDTFGWDTLSEGDALRLPRRRETDFFGTGPFFIRARLLLAVDADEILHPRRAARLQAILDYLEAPPPIDSWKRFIVTDIEEVPLVRLLAAWGVSLGLKSSIITGGTLLSATYPADARALASIRRGEAKVVELNGPATA